MKRIFWIALTFLAIMIMVGVVVVVLLNRPLGSALSLAEPTQAVQPIQPAVAQAAPEEQAEPPTQAPATAFPTPTATPQVVVQAPAAQSEDVMNLLVFGLNLPESGPRGADAIRLVRVDFEAEEARILPMPPDLRLGIPVTGLDGAEALSLTETYWFSKQAAPSPADLAEVEAAQTLAQTLYDLFGYRADHYMVVDQEAFVALIDELGGLEVDLPQQVDGTPSNYGVYEAGRQQLNGRRAVDFARLYAPGNDPSPTEAERHQRQDLLLKAMLKAGLQPANLLKIPALAAKVRQAVVTDLSAAQLLKLALLAQQAGDKAELLQVTQDMYLVDADGRATPDLAALLRLVAELQGE